MLLRTTTKLAPRDGIEPPTSALTVHGSTAELSRNKLNNKLADLVYYPSCHKNTQYDKMVDGNTQEEEEEHNTLKVEYTPDDNMAEVPRKLLVEVLR